MPRKSFFCELFALLGILFAMPAAAIAQPSDVPMAEAYRLGAGDKLRISVYKDDEITGEYEIDSSGNLSLKLVGTIPAVGRTLPELTKVIETKLRDGYLLDPRVAIDVMNYRPFYVLGEVNSPGSFPYVAGMTVLKAIALAGGYTFRARTSKIELIRASNPDEKLSVDQSTMLLPGDIIRIKERFF